MPANEKFVSGGASVDLSRAKTVLICTFLVLNIFLFSQILLDEGRGETGLFGRKEEMSKLESELQAVGLSLDVPLPKSGAHLAHMVAEPWHFQPEEIIFELYQALINDEQMSAEGLRDNSTNKCNNDANLAAYCIAEYELLVHKGGAIAFNRIRETGQPAVSPLDESEQAVKEFCRRVSFLNNFAYDYAKQERKGISLYFCQEYAGFSLYAGNLNFLWEGGSLAGLNFYRLEPVGFAEPEREIIPPSTALLRFVETYEKGAEKKKGIVDFSLGFYSQQYDAERWEIPPVWRIRLDSNEIYYINAFTGMLEQ